MIISLNRGLCQFIIFGDYNAKIKDKMGQEESFFVCSCLNNNTR